MHDIRPLVDSVSSSLQGYAPRRKTISGARRHVDNFALVRPLASEVVCCRSLGDLAEAVRTARSSGRRITLRGAGCSFHDQAQGTDLTVMPDIAAEPPLFRGDAIVASGSLSWGELYRFALAQGKLPMVAPTTAAARLAGAASSNSVSRFSALHGKESSQIESFTLLDGTGRLRRVHRPRPTDDHAEARLFRAVLGGFGGLGVLVDLTYRFANNPFGDIPRMKTEPSPCTDESELVERLVRHYRRGSGGEPHGAWGISDERGRAVFFEQRLVGSQTPLAPLALHRPQSVAHRVGVALCSLPSAARLMHLGTHHWMRHRRRPFVDELLGQQFMMDGSRVVRLAARRRGVTMPLLQQSFVLPIEGAGSSAALRFFELMRRELHDRRLVPSVVDSMVVPADQHPLSSSRDMAGVMISPAIQLLGHRRVADAEAAFRALSRTCAELGGRVHLTKLAIAEPDVLGQMYGEGVRRYRACRSQLDPDGVFGSPFLDRLIAAAG